MSLKCETPCDFGPCPYESGEYCSCEYWCGAEEPQDYPEAWECGVDDETEQPPDEPLPGWAPEYWDDVTEQPPADEVIGWDE